MADYLEVARRAVRYEAEVEEILCDRDGSAAWPFVSRGSARSCMATTTWPPLPLERIAPMVNDDLLAADPQLANLRTLAPNVEWMNGVQFYLCRDVPRRMGT